jgi:hypothetical protein
VGPREHSIRSIRTIEFRLDGAKWSLNKSYVGQSSDPASVPYGRSRKVTLSVIRCTIEGGSGLTWRISEALGSYYSSL